MLDITVIVLLSLAMVGALILLILLYNYFSRKIVQSTTPTVTIECDEEVTIPIIKNKEPDTEPETSLAKELEDINPKISLVKESEDINPKTLEPPGPPGPAGAPELTALLDTMPVTEETNSGALSGPAGPEGSSGRKLLPLKSRS